MEKKMENEMEARDGSCLGIRVHRRCAMRPLTARSIRLTWPEF